MTRRPGFLLAAAFIAVVAVIWIRYASSRSAVPARGATATVKGGAPPGSISLSSTGEPARQKQATPGAVDRAAIIPTGRSDVADDLNAPDGDIEKDLKIVNEIFVAWISNFRGEGNPVGDNREVTAALRGDNRLGIELIPRDHRALNDRGELCDRWGTPFRFHVLSRMQMEIRSAGPDRKFGTPDDAEWAPWPKNF